MNQNGNNGYGTGAEINLMVTVDPGATVTGTDFGIRFSSGSVSNSGTVAGLGAGLAGIIGTVVNVTNAGAINGDDGSGIFALTSATVTNTGMITGSDFGISTGTGNVTNSGTITASAGTAIQASTGNITNSGTISGVAGISINTGTIATSGAITGTGGTAISYVVAGTNRLTLQPGFSINGNVTTVGPATNNTLELGGVGSAAFNVSNVGPAAQYQGFGVFEKTGSSLWTLTGTPSQTTTWTLLGGLINFNQVSNFGDTAPITINGGGLQWATGNTADISFRLAPIGAGGATFDTNGNNVSFGTGLAGAGGIMKAGAGTLTLPVLNMYTGPTAINQGLLMVDGSIAPSVLTTVNAGGTLGGTGTVGNTRVNSGGRFAPGPQNAPGAMTVDGNLTILPGGQYIVQVNPTTASIANVTGTAVLGGTVLANFAPGGYVKRQYTILHADGGVAGAFASLGSAGLTNLSADLSYGGNDVFLNLAAKFDLTGFSQNQLNVATVISDFFNNGGALPANFLPLFDLTGVNLAYALSQLSGEAATAAQFGTFQLGNQFLSLMLDPLVYGRSPLVGPAPGGSGALRLAAEGAQSPEIALAYAKILKEPHAPAILVAPRWSVWAGGYGSANRTKGEPVFVGSHDVSASAGGYAAGIDYRIWPDTTVGVALGGGFTNWSLTDALGGGSSDAFQAGVYGVSRSGPAYLAGALAFAEHWMSTDRFAFAGDYLAARYNAQTYSGRLEGGWRLATLLGGVAPYAAVQLQSFDTPAYNETDAGLGGFGLNFNGRDASDMRTELGARFDHAFPLSTTAVLALNARAAWAHDTVSMPFLTPLFQTLPGTIFAVTGAKPVPNSALLSAGGELDFLNGWALSARFDGEYADRAQTYAGTGKLRYVW